MRLATSSRACSICCEGATSNEVTRLLRLSNLVKCRTARFGEDCDVTSFAGAALCGCSRVFVASVADRAKKCRSSSLQPTLLSPQRRSETRQFRHLRPLFRLLAAEWSSASRTSKAEITAFAISKGLKVRWAATHLALRRCYQ